MEELHNYITTTIVRYINQKKITVPEAILVLEIIKLDLVKQVTDKVYTKKPITMSAKKPTTIGEKDGGIQKGTPRGR